MDLTRLRELKQKLLHDNELAPIWLYFLDHCAEDQAFIDLGDQIEHPMIEAVIHQVSKQLFPRDGAVSGVLLTRIAEEKFIHGAFFMGLRPGGLFFYEDINMGLLVVPELPPSKDVKYARFSGRPMPKLGEPSKN
jgi:hypothetical protein